MKLRRSRPLQLEDRRRDICFSPGTPLLSFGTSSILLPASDQWNTSMNCAEQLRTPNHHSKVHLRGWNPEHGVDCLVGSDRQRWKLQPYHLLPCHTRQHDDYRRSRRVVRSLCPNHLSLCPLHPPHFHRQNIILHRVAAGSLPEADQYRRDCHDPPASPDMLHHRHVVPHQLWTRLCAPVMWTTHDPVYLEASCACYVPWISASERVFPTCAKDTNTVSEEV